MKMMRFKGLNKPLSEARKQNPRIEKAAVFVEGLYGRPLRNNPKITIGPGRFIVSRNVLETNTTTFTTVHELIHAEDLSKNIPKEIKQEGFLKKFKRHLRSLTGINCIPKNITQIKRMLYLEGRAVFGEQMFLAGKTRPFLNLRFMCIAIGTAGVIASATVPMFPEDRIMTAVYSLSILANGLPYWPFYNSICTIAKKIGDPIKAFRITKEKQPKTFSEILFPLKFYKDEIADALKEKNPREIPL